MSRLLQGDEGFKYAYTTVRRDLPIEDLARISRSGTLRFVVDTYNVHRADGEVDMLVLERIERLLGLPHDDDRGIYEADTNDVTAETLFQTLIAREREITVPAMQTHHGEAQIKEIHVFANIQYRFYQDTDWETMLAYLNGKLPDGATLTLDEVKAFSSDCLAEFDPEKHEPNREDGTGFLMYFLDNEEDGCLPYLGFRILVHAIEHGMEMLDIDDEPRWRKQLWPSLDGRPKKDRKPKAKKGKKGGAPATPKKAARPGAKKSR